jgi:hypothetical protein
MNEKSGNLMFRKGKNRVFPILINIFTRNFFVRTVSNFDR